MLPRLSDPEHASVTVAAERRLSIHIAHENDDGSWPDAFLCGEPIAVYLPGTESYAGDLRRSECEACNRIDAAYGESL